MGKVINKCSSRVYETPTTLTLWRSISMTIYYLYVKTHNKTGLKYLGKTKKDPFKYKGSGTFWSRHIKKHGYDVATEILKECTSNSEIKEWGSYYSKLWNVVESSSWANLCDETGDGGYRVNNHFIHYNSIPRTKSHNDSISKARKGQATKKYPVLINNVRYESMVDAARSLDVVEQTIYNWIKNGKAIKL